jgi:hypothetical protein
LLQSGKRVLLLLGFEGLGQIPTGREKENPDNSFSFPQFGSHMLRCSLGGAYSSMKFTLLEFGDWIKAPAPHSPICSCAGCTLHRNLVRDASRVRDHAENCTCKDCESFRGATSRASGDHINTCGCYLCQSTRDQKQWERRITDRNSCPDCTRRYAELNKAEPVYVGYQTLGMRIVRSFERRLLDILEPADTTSTMDPRVPVQRVGTATSVDLEKTTGSNTAISIKSQESRMT